MNTSIAAGELAQTSYNFDLVALSYAIAVIGSFVALTAAQRICRHGRIHKLNLLAASVALGGIGVWSMHFTGMLALNLGMGSGYSALETVLSLLAAVIATGMALAFVAKNPNDHARLLTAGGLLGLGIAFMHYLGMFGLRFPGYITWDWSIIALSVVIAIVAASVALWLAFRSASVALRGVASSLMGVAVCAMHYTAMEAADFVCTAPTTERFATPLGFGVISSLDLPMVAGMAAISMAALIGYDQLIQRTQENTATLRA